MIRGTRLTTFFSNLLVPGLYVLRGPKIAVDRFPTDITPPAAALLAVTWASSP